LSVTQSTQRLHEEHRADPDQRICLILMKIMRIKVAVPLCLLCALCVMLEVSASGVTQSTQRLHEEHRADPDQRLCLILMKVIGIKVAVPLCSLCLLCALCVILEVSTSGRQNIANYA
jgi:hypothetical protein